MGSLLPTGLAPISPSLPLPRTEAENPCMGNRKGKKAKVKVMHRIPGK